MQTKRCYQCKQEKALEEFAIKKTAKDGRAFECKTCHNEWCRNHYAKNRQYYIDRNKLTKLNNARKIQEFKRNSNGCVICKEKEPCCLDFHHLRDKKFTVSMMTTRSWKQINIEINKCIILCSNCHRKLHAGIVQLPKII